jgi:hypothetical protein
MKVELSLDKSEYLTKEWSIYRVIHLLVTVASFAYLLYNDIFRPYELNSVVQGGFPLVSSSNLQLSGVYST